MGYKVTKFTNLFYAKILFLGRHKRPGCPNDGNNKIPPATRNAGIEILINSSDARDKSPILELFLVP